MGSAADVARVLSAHISPGRLLRMRDVLSRRLVDTVLVFEGITDGHNVSACLRTADALGIHRVEIIERWQESFLSLTSVDKGAAKWLDVRRHKDVDSCVASLHADSYAVYATDLTPGSIPLHDAVSKSLIPLTPRHVLNSGATRPRIALVMGNEHRGVSKHMLSRADVRFFVPQMGFVQSMNLSVAEAVISHSFLHRTSDYALWMGRRYVPAAPPLLPHVSNSTSTPALEGGVQPMATSTGLGVEPLTQEMRDIAMTRWLLMSVANAELILDRYGVRPTDL